MVSSPAHVIYASDPITEMLKNEPQPVRVLPFQVRQAQQRDPFLTGDALMTYRIRNVLGYHGNQLGRYAAAPGELTNDLTGTNTGGNQLLSPNVLQLTNTRYFLTNIPELPFIGNTTLVKGPVRNASGDTVYLYRLNAENPYSWVTPVAVKAPDVQVLATILNPRFDLTRAALFDTSANVTVAQGVQSLPAPLAITTTVRHYEAGRVQIDLSGPAPEGSSLVVSENYYPGWIAEIDGKSTPIVRSDALFRAVEVPAGAHRVIFRFAPFSPANLRAALKFVLGLTNSAGHRQRPR